MYPLDFGDVRGRAFIDSLYILFLALFTCTDFHVSFICMLLSFASIHYVAIPVMYTEEVLSLQQITEKLTIELISIFFFISINCLITLLGNLLAQNRRRTEECISLLNWIQNGVLLQNLVQVDKVIRFANLSSKRLLKEFHLMDEDVTWEDTLKRIFKKVDFSDQREPSSQEVQQ